MFKYYEHFKQEGGLESNNLHYGAVVTIPMDISSKCGNFTSAEFDLTSTICASGTAASICKKISSS
jgi:hypothetical protein